MSNTIENVLILQGGGSLGAFGCGVFKALINSNIKLDIVRGTSCGLISLQADSTILLARNTAEDANLLKSLAAALLPLPCYCDSRVESLIRLI
jgi:hypothetical protein